MYTPAASTPTCRTIQLQDFKQKLPSVSSNSIHKPSNKKLAKNCLETRQVPHFNRYPLYVYIHCCDAMLKLHLTIVEDVS